jgi:hypothetical protein
MLKDDAVLGIWPIAADSLDTYGDVLLAVFNNVVVAAYDISDYTRGEDNKVTFAGQDSPSWAHLVGQPNPGKHWGGRAMLGQCVPAGRRLTVRAA